MDLHQNQNDREVCADLTLKGFTALGTKDNKTEVIAAIDRLERQGQKGLAEQLRMILDRSTGAKKGAG